MEIFPCGGHRGVSQGGLDLLEKVMGEGIGLHQRLPDGAGLGLGLGLVVTVA